MKKSTEPEIHVSDHAIARYLERVLQYPIADLRKQIADDCRVAVLTGARSMIKDGFQYHFQEGRVATITLPSPTPSATARRLAMKRPPTVAG